MLNDTKEAPSVEGFSGGKRLSVLTPAKKQSFPLKDISQSSVTTAPCPVATGNRVGIIN